VREASAALQTLSAGSWFSPWMWDSPALSESPATREIPARLTRTRRRATPRFTLTESRGGVSANHHGHVARAVRGLFT
jgi:hypothetical protein